MNWEAMQVALERLRIMTISGRHTESKAELVYLIDNLNKLLMEEVIYDSVADSDSECKEPSQTVGAQVPSVSGGA